ncbi:B12-binding domain-containing radical SAM protein [Clostridium sp. JS66]|uniref:B12-binding domain-containing radical SAM protein n=1 Tax=Clostridium sp. JS66 TaxID=3064705 RepID=UPI00298DEBED|nr:B12-binding domain-containing radical SAM protein [Clostridium sp. JS66]WPC44764.1 B12-binding domain-containing radical SAM protein [Clostridium sp. JS66]
MKVVLTALNSKFIHSNLAIRYLKAYTKDLNYECILREFTINDRREKVLEQLIKEEPDVIAFSCYIWNIEFIQGLAKLINLVNPNIKILYGGPEVSYDSVSFLRENVGEYVIVGEGEETYREFINWQLEREKVEKNSFNEETLEKLKSIKGLSFKIGEKVYFNGDRELMDLNKVIFPYNEQDNLQNKIVYYEASRGCPFNCKYCLSSTTHGVRFFDINRVKKELRFLVNKEAKLVKFVDRTFNCNVKFAMDVWKFLIELDTEATFHFEISADILTEEEIKLLSNAPKGRIQFEVGVQTTNNEILKNINRNVNFEDIREKVEELESIKNIKQHLDLIAGLPGENIKSFKNSFNDVYSIRPEEIQLGFLKLLKGSPMREEAPKWGMVYSPYAPYEILKTKDISYNEIIILKRIEEVLDKYYNSRKFDNVLNYFLPKFETSFDFYKSLGEFFYDKGYLNRNISSAEYYRVFIEFNEESLKENSNKLKEIIKYDYLKFNKKKWIPEFLVRERNKEEERKIKEKVINEEIKLSKNYHMEKFFLDINKYINENQLEEKQCYILFDESDENEIQIDI